MFWHFFVAYHNLGKLDLECFDYKGRCCSIGGTLTGDSTVSTCNHVYTGSKNP